MYCTLTSTSAPRIGLAKVECRSTHLDERSRDVQPFQHGSDLGASTVDHDRVHTALEVIKQQSQWKEGEIPVVTSRLRFSSHTTKILL